MLQQGEDYKEIDLDGEPSDIGSEFIREDIEEEDKGSSFNISAMDDKKKIFIVAGVIVLVLVVATVGIFAAKKHKEAKDAEYLAMLEAEEEDAFKYTAEEVEKLRLNGYTGTEIESFEQSELDSATKIKEAEDKRKEFQEKELKPIMDGASDKYKNLAKNTWVGQKDFSVGKNIDSYEYYEYTCNADYILLPPKGNQLFAKCTINDKGDVLFVTLTPERYLELKPKGNMVLSIMYTDTGVSKIVTSVSEVLV